MIKFIGFLILVFGVLFFVSRIIKIIVSFFPSSTRKQHNEDNYQMTKRIASVEHSNTSEYYALLEQAEQTQTDSDKLRIYEQMLQFFPGFVAESMKRDGELPTIVPPRDMLPELYMRVGEWEKARKTADFCFSIGAYGKIEYTDDIKLIEIRQAAAEGLLGFLRNNPGYLQKNVYKEPALFAYDHDALKWVCRSFKLIRKEKAGNTNKLYIKG